MLTCQHGQHLQPSTDPNDNTDWTSASRLHEIPSFISTNSQSDVQVSSPNINPNFNLPTKGDFKVAVK